MGSQEAIGAGIGASIAVVLCLAGVLSCFIWRNFYKPRQRSSILPQGPYPHSSDVPRSPLASAAEAFLQSSGLQRVDSDFARGETLRTSIGMHGKSESVGNDPLHNLLRYCLLCLGPGLGLRSIMLGFGVPRFELHNVGFSHMDR